MVARGHLNNWLVKYFQTNFFFYIMRLFWSNECFVSYISLNCWKIIQFHLYITKFRAINGKKEYAAILHCDRKINCLTFQTIGCEVLAIKI